MADFGRNPEASAAHRGAGDGVRRLAAGSPPAGLAGGKLLERRCAELAGAPLACLIVDLVRFRDVNYALGHLHGEALLAQAGGRLAELVGDAGLVARADGRFRILLPGLDAARTRAWAERILAALASPVVVAGIGCESGARVGAALAPGDGSDYHTLLRKADIALYQAARAARSSALYDAAHDPHTPARLGLVGDFRAAIEQGQLRLFCQPKVDMRRGRIVGAEALVRWRHPDQGWLAPDAFVPLIESTELVHLLTRHMLARALDQCEAWRRRGVHLPLAVNLSARDVAALSLSEHLRELLLRHGAGAGMIGLEMTESSLMKNPEAGIAELERLRRMGFRLYVDDFGTGYSSLSYLSRLPVDVIKIDHGFTMAMVGDRRAAAIVKATIHLAHDLGMTVVAEGVSERRIWDALVLLGCDEAQGYFTAPPLPAHALLDWAAASPFALQVAGLAA